MLYILSKRKLLCLVPQPKGSSLTFGGLFTNSGATVLCMHVYMSIGVCVCVSVCVWLWCVGVCTVVLLLISSCTKTNSEIPNTSAVNSRVVVSSHQRRLCCLFLLFKLEARTWASTLIMPSQSPSAQAVLSIFTGFSSTPGAPKPSTPCACVGQDEVTVGVLDRHAILTAAQLLSECAWQVIFLIRWATFTISNIKRLALPYTSVFLP